MSLLTLVRHGQASFFADDYDRLSPLGERQARLLGEHWSRERRSFTEVCVGPRMRQRQTAEIVGRTLREAGLPWPEPVLLDELDEYDLDGLSRHLAPALAAQDMAFAQLVDAYRDAQGERQRLMSFQIMFEALLGHWQTAGSERDGVESWPAFHGRLRRIFAHLQQRSTKGARVAMFTSGGLIGGAVQQTLGAPDRAALQLNWRVLNCSLTELVFTNERMTLDSFNAVPHLTDPELRTYR